MAIATATTTTAVPARARKRSGGLKRWWWRFKGFGLKARRKFYEKLYRFTSRGIPLDAALENLYRRAKSNKLSTQHVLRQLLIAQKAGQVKFGEALSEWVPASEAILVQAGEDAGSKELPGAFQRASFVAKAGSEIRSSIIGNAIQPMILFLLVLIILLGASFFLLPLLSEIQPDQSQWPMLTSVLFFVGMAVRTYWWVGVLLVVGGGWLVMRSLSRWVSPMRRRVDKWLFPYTLYRVYNAGGVMIALSSLTQQGVPFTKSLPIMASVSNPWLKDHLYRALNAIRASVPTGKALDTGLFEKDLAADLQDYDQAQSLEAVMEQIGQDVIVDVQERVEAIFGFMKGMAMMIAMLSILLIYGGIGLLVFSIADASRGAL